MLGLCWGVMWHARCRSTFLGSGAYAAHWTGDTNSRWTDMRWSITTILNNGIAGISFSGADICGFMEKATEELCARWIAVGAFYPYARDHHSDGWQELFRCCVVPACWPSALLCIQSEHHAAAEKKVFGTIDVMLALSHGLLSRSPLSMVICMHERPPGCMCLAHIQQALSSGCTACRWEQVSVVSRKVLAARYRLMPYLYTAFFDSHTYGCPVARPLFFGWSSDNTTRAINEQWMMGDALLVSPILYESTSTARAYFPAGTWYDFYTGRAFDAKNGTFDYVRVSARPQMADSTLTSRLQLESLLQCA